MTVDASGARSVERMSHAAGTDGVSPLRPNVVLTGFMATGKSTVGRVLAARLRYGFVDTDRIMPARFLREKSISISVRSAATVDRRSSQNTKGRSVKRRA